MTVRYTITRKPLPPPEAFRRTVHEAEILAEYQDRDGEWRTAIATEGIIREMARLNVHRFEDVPTEMNHNRLKEISYIGEGRWLVRIEEAYLD